MDGLIKAWFTPIEMRIVFVNDYDYVQKSFTQPVSYRFVKGILFCHAISDGRE